MTLEVGDLIPIGGSNIKSLQRGTASMSNTQTSINISIDPINPNNSIVLIDVDPELGGTQYTREILVNPIITNSTTINLTRNASVRTLKIGWTVIEFNNVKSKQTGSVSIDTCVQISGVAKFVSIDPVAQDRCILVLNKTWLSSHPSSSPENMLGYAQLISSNTIEFDFPTEYNRPIAHYQLIEFK